MKIVVTLDEIREKNLWEKATEVLGDDFDRERLDITCHIIISKDEAMAIGLIANPENGRLLED